MFSEKCKLQGLKGIKQLDRIGHYLIITNRWRHESGGSSRYALINESKLCVQSIHVSQQDAIVFARQQNL